MHCFSLCSFRLYRSSPHIMLLDEPTPGNLKIWLRLLRICMKWRQFFPKAVTWYSMSSIPKLYLLYQSCQEPPGPRDNWGPGNGSEQVWGANQSRKFWRIRGSISGASENLTNSSKLALDWGAGHQGGVVLVSHDDRLVRSLLLHLEWPRMVRNEVQEISPSRKSRVLDIYCDLEKLATFVFGPGPSFRNCMYVYIQ